MFGYQIQLNYHGCNLACPYLAINKVSGMGRNQDTESFIQLIEKKINCAFGDAPGDAHETANHTFREIALFSYLVRGPAAEQYANNIMNGTTWGHIRTIFITRYPVGENKFWY